MAAWNRFTMPIVYAADPTGTPAGGEKLYFYVTGTSEPLDTYADSTLSTPNPNPVVADQNGNFPPIFLLNQQYKVVRVTPAGATVWTADPVSPYIPTAESSTTTIVLQCVVDGNQQTPLAGICGDLYVPFDCTIESVTLQADQAGDVVVDVWATPFETNSPPSAVNSICASDLPTLASSQSMIDTTLTGWQTAIPAGTALRFNIVSIDTLTRFNLQLNCSAGITESE